MTIYRTAVIIPMTPASDKTVRDWVEGSFDKDSLSVTDITWEPPGDPAGDRVKITLSTQDEELAAWHVTQVWDMGLTSYASIVHTEDEHDRVVDRPYQDEARALEGEDKLGFMDMAHALSYAMHAMQERIHNIGGSTIPTEVLYVQRLKMSHDRLAELLLQRDDDDEGMLEAGDGWLTKFCDVLIRG